MTMGPTGRLRFLEFLRAFEHIGGRAMQGTRIVPLARADHLRCEVRGSHIMRFPAYLLLGAALAAPATAAPVDDILAANRTATGGNAWSGKAGLNLKYSYVGQGLSGTTTTTFD